MTPTDASQADHPALDTLAADDLGDSDPTLAAQLAAHLAGCDHCRERKAALERARADLAALDPEPMPALTAARLQGRLRQEIAASGAANPGAVGPVGPVTTTGGTSRRWTLPGPALAAAAAAVLLASGLVVGALRSGGGGTSSSGSSAAASGSVPLAALGTYRQVTSPVNYTATTLAAGLGSLLGAGPVAAAGAAAGTTTGNTPLSAQAPTAQAAAPAPSGAAAASPLHSGPNSYAAALTPADAALARLAGRPALTSCLSALLPGHRAVRTPLVEAFARYDGIPAAIIVQPEPAQPGNVEVWVVGAACGQPGAGPNLLHFAVLPRP